MNTDLYHRNSYLLLQNFFKEEELKQIEPILKKFHQQWLAVFQTHFKEGLINSHSLTGSNYLTSEERLELFHFISHIKIIEVIQAIFPAKAKFLNTQLFFDPYNGEQKNYWHRDIQYTGLSIEEQKEKILHENVVHFRIPLKQELGIELIPSSHRQWDLPIEEDTRLSNNGKTPNDSLDRGRVLSLDRGDLLVFSANSIHRGLYGNERFSFDIIYCDDSPTFDAFIDSKNQPSKEELAYLNTSIF